MDAKKPEPEKLAASQKAELPKHEEQKLIKESDAQRLSDLEGLVKRLQAEFENYRKRTDKERETLLMSGSASMIMKLLPVLDDMEIALAASHKDASAKETRHGFEMLHRKMLQVLEKEGLSEMKALGEQFDPYRHEAVRTADADEDGKVVEVLKKGYLFRGNVLRHAMVVVGKKREEKTQQGKAQEKTEAKK